MKTESEFAGIKWLLRQIQILSKPIQNGAMLMLLSPFSVLMPSS